VQRCLRECKKLLKAERWPLCWSTSWIISKISLHLSDKTFSQSSTDNKPRDERLLNPRKPRDDWLLKLYFCICVNSGVHLKRGAKCLQWNLRQTLPLGNHKQKSAGDRKQPEASLSLQHSSNTRDGKCKSFQAPIENPTHTGRWYRKSSDSRQGPIHSSGHFTWRSSHNSSLHFYFLHAALSQFATDSAFMLKPHARHNSYSYTEYSQFRAWGRGKNVELKAAQWEAAWNSRCEVLFLLLL